MRALADSFPRPGVAAAMLFGFLAAGGAAAAPITFPTVRTGFASGGALQVTVAADFDGDHDPDLATADFDGNVRLLSNTGGVFAAPVPVAVPFPVRFLAAGDLNGDGRADLVGGAVTTADGALAVLLAGGAGFAPAVTVPTDSAGIAAVTLGDLDGDGDLDIVASNRQTRKVHRLFNDGAGNFSGLTSTRIPGEVSRTWVADLDGDGNADLLTGNWPHLMIGGGFTGFRSAGTTLRGTGGGAFAAPIPANVRSVIALGAFRAPGSHDALVLDSLGLGIAVGAHDGTFAAPVRTPGAWPFCGEGFAMALDLEGDARDEIVGATGGGCSTTQNWGTFRVDDALQVVHRKLYYGAYGLDPAAADFDGDGSIDVALGNGLVERGHGDHFDGARVLTRYEANAGLYDDIQDLDAADWNGDGADDVFVTTRFYSGAYFQSNRDGTFQIGVPFQGDSYIRQTALTDLDADGDLDMLQLHNDPGLTNHLFVVLQGGAGSMLTLPSTYCVGLITADFDGDGDVDAITEDTVGHGVLLFTNDGTGHFTIGTCALPLAGSFYGHADGDLLPARYSTVADSIQVEHATSPGMLGPPIRTWVGGALVSARFADVDGDGRTDAVCLLAGAEVRTFLGGGSGAWIGPVVCPEAAIAPGYTATFGNIGDLDGDGRPDLLFTGAGTPAAISVLRNLGSGAFGERGDSFTSQPFGTVIGDVNGDGAGDLLGTVPELPIRFPPNPTKTVDILFGAPPATPTPTLVSLASSDATFERARLTWWVPAGGPSSLRVERREPDGAWSVIATIAPSAGEAVYEDRAVSPGARYGYRLAWEEGGITQHSAETSLAIPARFAFAIEGVQPNPGGGDRVRIALALDRPGAVEVKLVDVAGRIVASRTLVPAAPGRVSIDLDGLSTLRAGLYFVRAEQAGRRVARTWVRLR